MPVPEIPHCRTARRLTWEFLPPELRAEIESRLGGKVVRATSHTGGYTPGFASTLRTANGAALFVKTANKTAQAVAARSYAIEAATHQRLAPRIPSPRLLWVSDGDWITLAFEHVDATSPQRPWDDAEFSRVLDLAEKIATVEPPGGLSPLAEDAPAFVTSWTQVAARVPDHPCLEEADELARRLGDIPATALSHGDLRDDNVLLGSDGATLACDWTSPALAPAWLDTMTLAISAYGDGLDVDRHLTDRAVLRGTSDDEVDVWLAAFAGFMRYSSLLGPVRNSPYLRAHADWYATVAWEWLAERRCWPEASLKRVLSED